MRMTYSEETAKKDFATRYTFSSTTKMCEADGGADLTETALPRSFRTGGLGAVQPPTRDLETCFLKKAVTRHCSRELNTPDRADTAYNRTPGSYQQREEDNL